ncbi:HNH endonuclease signature motif containing protein, partial [Arthrobacter sp. ISL-5]|uniref:HNH endonuclease signature motif containing protein n=1 Tax=Arthrobacter sp. ISL-5 TaxID=2819111 RepID=UPI002035C8AC
APAVSAVAGTAAAGASSSAATSTSAAVPAVSPADDGSRNTAEFLRTRLRIGAGEARRRLALASAILPRTGITGQPMPPAYEETAAALATGTIASRAGTIITTALDRVRHLAAPADLARMEHTLTRTAIENDHDFLTRIAHRWADAIDQDGTEPTEEDLRHRQGAFLRRPRRGLHHLEIFATPDQYEHLLTVMNTATNPRTQPTPSPDAGTGGDSGDGGDSGTDNADGALPGPGFGAAAETAAADAPLERRTRPQQLLDGLIGACKAALATGTLPATGGLRPQVMVTISYQDLLNRLETTAANGPRYTAGNPSPTRGSHPSLAGSVPESPAGHLPASPAGHLPASTADGPPGTATGTGTFTFTGPVAPATIRKIACDADIIPVLLGSEGRILDIGRTTRIFPPHIRKAITARDQGCTFPNCTIPAPWCEAHHTTYWSHGGPTNTDNGTLLCSHHHHLIHKEQWTIHMQSGVPWFIPPPHIDPRQVPRRNNYFRLE